MKWLRVFLIAFFELFLSYMLLINLVFFLSDIVGYNIIFPNITYTDAEFEHKLFGFSSMVMALRDYNGPNFNDLLTWAGGLLQTITGNFFDYATSYQNANNTLEKVLSVVTSLFDFLTKGLVQPLIFTARVIKYTADLLVKLWYMLGWFNNILQGYYNVNDLTASCLADNTCDATSWVNTDITSWISS